MINKKLQMHKVGRYFGEYSYEIKGQIFSEKIEGPIPNVDPFEKVDTVLNFDLNLLANFSKLNPDRGKISITIQEDEWLAKNNKYYELIQKMEKEGLEFHLFRDRDFTLNAVVKNSHCEKTILKYHNLESLTNSATHPTHHIAVTWGIGNTRLIIDDEVVDICPRNSTNFNIWGVALGKQGKIEEALEKFAKAIELDQKNADAFTNKAYTHFKIRDFKSSIEYYKKALRINKTHQML
jgi:tetratricopeptide (TPR) repeat protein